MSDSYSINGHAEVVPYSGGRMHTDTASWRDATELELTQQQEIKDLESQVEEQREYIQTLESKIDELIQETL